MNNQVVDASPLSNPSVLPWRLVTEIAHSPALVVAPHPDDETLGCGGAIALLRSLNCDVRVLVISDGTLSHPRSQKYPGHALRELRESETLLALSVLGVEPNAVTFLRLQDGSIPAHDKNAVASCRTYLTEVAPQIIFLPWRYDPHPDHRSTWKLIHTAHFKLRLSPRFIEYPIWDWDPEQRDKGVWGVGGVGGDEGDEGDKGDNLTSSSPSSSPSPSSPSSPSSPLPTPPQKLTTWRLNIDRVVELKQQAIAAYRSQTTNLIDDDPEGFRLTPEMLLNFTRPWEVYLEEIQ